MDSTVTDKPLVALQDTLQQMREQMDSKVLVELTLEYIRNVFVAPLIWLALYDYDNHQLVGQGGVTLLEDYSLLLETYPLQPGEIMEQVVIEQRSMAIPDMSQEPRMGFWQQQAKPLGGIQGCIIYPIRTQRRCLGVLMLGSQVWGINTTEEEKALLGILLGQLSASLVNLETLWKQQNEQRADEPLLLLGTQLRSLSSMDERLAVTAQSLREFTGVQRVQVYWFDRLSSHFFLRWGRPPQSSKPPSKTSGQKPSPKTPSKLPPTLEAPGIAFQASYDALPNPAPGFVLTTRDLGDMYYTLTDGQLVSATEASGAVRSEVTPKLMQQLGAQAVLAAPILFQQELLGFISLESDLPRIWADTERQLIAGAANLLALAGPLEQVDILLDQIESNQELVGDVARSIYSDGDLQQALDIAVEGVAERLEISVCLVLLYEPETGTFNLFHEHRPNVGSRSAAKPTPTRFGPLNEQDWRDLLQDETVAAENYAQDLRMLSWKQELDSMGVRSLMVTHTGSHLEQSNRSIEGVLVIPHSQLRAWNREERRFLRSVAEQLGVVLRQSQLQQAQQRQEQVLDGLIQTVMTLQHCLTAEDLFQATTPSTAQLLNAPLALIAHWVPGAEVGYVYAPIGQESFRLTGSEQIDYINDPLIANCLQSESGFVAWNQTDLAPITQAWLSAPGLGTVLAVPLAGSGSSLGVLVVGAELGRVWAYREQLILIVLGQVCGWTLQRLLWTQTLQGQAEILNELNWYKHRRLADMHTSLLENLRRLGQVPETPGNEATRWQKVVEIARSLREQTLLTQPLLQQQELWILNPAIAPIPVAVVIRRSLARIDNLGQKRQIRFRVNGDTNMTIQSDQGRVEMVIHDLLVTAVMRSPESSYIDLWVQESSGYADLLIVDSGIFDVNLMAALSQDPQWDIYGDPLLPTILSQSPGRELSLCRRILQRLGGELSFYQMPEGQNVSRLLLPLMMEPSVIDDGGLPET